LLRRHVSRRTNLCPGRGERLVVGLQAGNSKVKNSHIISIRPDQKEIRRIQIPMNNSPTVRLGDRSSRATDNANCSCQTKATPTELRREVHPFQPLHDKIRDPGGSQIMRDVARNSGMLEFGKSRSLAFEALWTRGTGPQSLDGDLNIGDEILGEIHVAHPAALHQFLNAKPTA
jgi:hypothetical protein